MDSQFGRLKSTSQTPASRLASFGTPPPDAKSGVISKNILIPRDISSITGVHRTNIIKFLADLEKLELIERLPSAIYIKDLPALEQLVRSLDIA